MYFLISINENETENGLCRVKLRNGNYPIAFSNIDLGEKYLKAMNLNKYNSFELSNRVPEEWFSKFPVVFPKESCKKEIAFVNSLDVLKQLIDSPETFNSYYGGTCEAVI